MDGWDRWMVIIGLLQGVPKKSIFLKFQDRKCIRKSGPFWTMSDNFGQFLHFGLFWTIWTILDRFGPFWTVWTVWTILDRFGPFWTVLNRFGPFWTVFDRF